MNERAKYSPGRGHAEEQTVPLFDRKKNHVDSSGFHAVSRSFENTRDTLFAWKAIDTDRAAFRKYRKCRKVFCIRVEETTPRHGYIEISRYVRMIHDSRWKLQPFGMEVGKWLTFSRRVWKAIAIEIGWFAFLGYRNCRKKRSFGSKDEETTTRFPSVSR